MRNVAMIVCGGLGALFVLAAMANGVGGHEWARSTDADEIARVDQRNALRDQDAWIEFWAGGALLIATGAIAAWPARQHSGRRP